MLITILDIYKNETYGDMQLLKNSNNIGGQNVAAYDSLSFLYSKITETPFI